MARRKRKQLNPVLELLTKDPSLTILGEPYLVLQNPGVGTKSSLGEALPQSSAIWINPELGRPVLWAYTFVHEVAEVIFGLTGDSERNISGEDFAVLGELLLRTLGKMHEDPGFAYALVGQLWEPEDPLSIRFSGVVREGFYGEDQDSNSD